MSENTQLSSDEEVSCGYMVLSYDKIFSLEKAVDARLKQGWSFVGGVAVAVSHYHDRHDSLCQSITYAQAMVKI